MKKQSSLFVKKTQRPHSHKCWKILIVDDEEDVHTITQTVLSNFSFQERKLEFFHAYNAQESIDIMKKESDIALVLLDVVMEKDDSGLQVVKEIREVLQNHLVRIILRTGQPGSAPEEEVIVEYDINDYKEKTELTSKKLFTTLVTALRSYQSLKSLQRGKDGLILIIESSAELFKIHSLQKFASGVLTQIMPILSFDNDAMYLQVHGFTAQKEQESFKVLAGTGIYDLAKSPQPQIEPETLDILKESMESEKSIFKANAFVGYISLHRGIQHFIYMRLNGVLTQAGEELMELFLKNIAIAFENVYFNKDILDKKEEVIGLCKEFTYKFNEISQND